MSSDIFPQHVECNVVNYNNLSYEDGYLSDSVSNCSYSTVAESEIVGARIKLHEQQFLDQHNRSKELQNIDNSDKYQVVNIRVDKLHIYGDKEGNRKEQFFKFLHSLIKSTRFPKYFFPHLSLNL